MILVKCHFISLPRIEARHYYHLGCSPCSVDREVIEMKGSEGLQIATKVGDDGRSARAWMMNRWRGVRGSRE